MSQLFGMVGFLCFVAAMQRVSRFIGNLEGASICSTVMLLTLMSVLILAGVTFFPRALFSVLGRATMLVPLFAVLLMVGTFFMFLATLNQVKLSLLDGAVEDGDVF